MAVKTITVQSTSRTALLDYTMEAIETDGMQFDNQSGRVFLIVTNIDATATVVTAEGQTACEVGTIHDYGPMSCANGNSIILGPFNPSYYNDANNLVQLTITGTEASGGTIAAIKLVS
jgi:hypothetical protein